MKSRKLPMLLWLLILLALSALSGCGGDGKDPTPRNNPTPDTTGSVQIDATAGGFGVEPDDPKNKYTYFNLASGQVVELTDSEAAVSENWHVAFKRTNVKLNGSVSGPASVKGAVADAQDDFYDGNGDPDSSVFLNATAASERAAFDGVVSTDGLSFEEDRNIPYIKGDGSSEGWWLYSGPPDHTVSANPDQWWLIKSASTDSYAKFHVTDIVQASSDITLELFIQGAADSAFSATATTWIAAIGSAGGSKCFDIDAAAEVDCTTAAADWDIKVEVAGQAWNIWINGGVSGDGSGGAFGPFDTAGVTGYVNGTASPGGTDISGMYGQDSEGGIFKDNTWYAYGLQDNSKLWPNYRVYVIDTGTAQYKTQILGYYNAAGTSGHITLRYAPVLSAETVNVTLEEWSVSLDKTTVKTGNINFRVSNKGPDDVHEFVVIKTGLAPDVLPSDSQKVDENGAGIEIIGEIEGIKVGTDVHVTSMDLEPGNYVLICNIWDEDEQESHYGEGMRVAFTVVTN
ncbi:MAG TPA: hypothetical protein ENI94_10145 [Gammaproteobacteria bacterium]|nr:hypothetical protein [Gammaproteobacteria bacterium]